MYGAVYDLVMRLPDLGVVDGRWVIAWVLIAVGGYGLFLRWPHG